MAEREGVAVLAVAAFEGGWARVRATCCGLSEIPVIGHWTSLV